MRGAVIIVFSFQISAANIAHLRAFFAIVRPLDWRLLHRRLVRIMLNGLSHGHCTKTCHWRMFASTGQKSECVSVRSKAGRSKKIKTKKKKKRVEPSLNAMQVPQHKRPSSSLSDASSNSATNASARFSTSNGNCGMSTMLVMA